MAYADLSMEEFKNEERIRELKKLLDVIVRYNERLNEELALCYEKREKIYETRHRIYMARGGFYGMP